MTAARSSSGSSESAAGTYAPVSYFRVYDAVLVRNVRIRATELDRYQQECWEEAIKDWLHKSRYTARDDKEKKSPLVVVGIRLDQDLTHRFKVQASKLDRTHGDCLEEAAHDWLKKHRAKR